MRYLQTAMLIISALLFAACSSSKMIETASLNQAPCTNQSQITSQSMFSGETADNLNVYQQGDIVFATMNVRTYCNARIAVEPQLNGEQLRIKLSRTGSEMDSCVCNTNVTASFKNVKPGSYDVMVMNAGGTQILAEQNFTIK